MFSGKEQNLKQGQTNNKESTWLKQKHWLKAGGQTWRKPCGLGL